MGQLNSLDVMFIVIVGVSALVAIVRGFTREAFSIMGWIIAGFAVYYLLPVMDPIMQKYIASEVLASVVSGMVILIVFSLFWLLMSDKVCQTIRTSKLSYLDRILGFAFGVARGALIVILIQIMIASLIQEETQKGVFAESRCFKMAGEMADPIKKMIPEEWLASLKGQLESLNKKLNPDVEKTGKAKNFNEITNKDVSEAAEKIIKIGGDELFDSLVQPKTKGDVAADVENSEAVEKSEVEANKDSEVKAVEEEDESDLDRLIDVLDERVVKTEKSDETADSQTDEIVEIEELPERKTK